MYKNTWKIHTNSVCWCNLKHAQKNGLQFYQTRSNAITLFNTLPAVCIEKVVFLKTGEELHSKVYQSPRLPRRTVLTPHLHHGRQDLLNPRARTSADHQSKRSEKYEETRSAKFEETRSGNMDFRIQGPPHSTVQKEDYNRRQMVKILVRVVCDAKSNKELEACPLSCFKIFRALCPLTCIWCFVPLVVFAGRSRRLAGHPCLLRSCVVTIWLSRCCPASSAHTWARLRPRSPVGGALSASAAEKVTQCSGCGVNKT